MAVAESLDAMAGELEKALKRQEGQGGLKVAVAALLKKTIKQHKRIIFNGNGYSEEWQKEAASAGCSTTRTPSTRCRRSSSRTPSRRSSKFKVLNERELHARYEVNLENYSKTDQRRSAADGADGQPLHPAGGARVPEARRRERGGGEERRRDQQGRQQAPRSPGVKLVDKFSAQIESLAHALDHGNGSAEKHAKYMRDTIVPGMAKLRDLGDQIEVLIPHELWPMPTYREMLFVK